MLLLSVTLPSDSDRLIVLAGSLTAGMIKIGTGIVFCLSYSVCSVYLYTLTIVVNHVHDGCLSTITLFSISDQLQLNYKQNRGVG